MLTDPRSLIFRSLLTCLASVSYAHSQNVDWTTVGNDPGCTRYSRLDQIRKDNVQELQVAWVYHTGELDRKQKKTIECTPIVIDGVMYITTGHLRLIALDGSTGGELWQFDPMAMNLSKKQNELKIKKFSN